MNKVEIEHTIHSHNIKVLRSNLETPLSLRKTKCNFWRARHSGYNDVMNTPYTLRCRTQGRRPFVPMEINEVNPERNYFGHVLNQIQTVVSYLINCFYRLISRKMGKIGSGIKAEWGTVPPFLEQWTKGADPSELKVKTRLRTLEVTAKIYFGYTPYEIELISRQIEVVEKALADTNRIRKNKQPTDTVLEAVCRIIRCEIVSLCPILMTYMKGQSFQNLRITLEIFPDPSREEFQRRHKCPLGPTWERGRTKMLNKTGGQACICSLIDPEIYMSELDNRMCDYIVSMADKKSPVQSIDRSVQTNFAQETSTQPDSPSEKLGTLRLHVNGNTFQRINAAEDKTKTVIDVLNENVSKCDLVLASEVGKTVSEERVNDTQETSSKCLANNSQELPAETVDVTADDETDVINETYLLPFIPLLVDDADVSREGSGRFRYAKSWSEVYDMCKNTQDSYPIACVKCEDAILSQMFQNAVPSKQEEFPASIQAMQRLICNPQELVPNDKVNNETTHKRCGFEYDEIRDIEDDSDDDDDAANDGSDEYENNTDDCVDSISEDDGIDEICGKMTDEKCCGIMDESSDNDETETDDMTKDESCDNSEETDDMITEGSGDKNEANESEVQSTDTSGVSKKRLSQKSSVANNPDVYHELGQYRLDEGDTVLRCRKGSKREFEKQVRKKVKRRGIPNKHLVENSIILEDAKDVLIEDGVGDQSDCIVHAPEVIHQTPDGSGDEMRNGVSSDISYDEDVNEEEVKADTRHENIESCVVIRGKKDNCEFLEELYGAKPASPKPKRRNKRKQNSKIVIFNLNNSAIDSENESDSDSTEEPVIIYRTEYAIDTSSD